MNSISLYREIPELPESVNQYIRLAQMLVLEDSLRSTNHLLEPDLHLALFNELSKTYWWVNHYPYSKRVVVESSL